MEQPPSDITPEIPAESDERPERYPSEGPAGEANDDPNFQDDQDEDIDSDQPDDPNPTV